MRACQQQAEKPAQRRELHHRQDQENPLPRAKRRIKDERHEEQCDRHNECQAAVGALLTFIFARPVQVIALGKLHFLPYLFYRLPHRAAQIAPAHAVFDRDITRVAFAINRGRSVIQANVAHLAQRDPLARGGKNPDVTNILHRGTELWLVAHYQVVALFADQNLAQGLPTHRSFHRILNIAYVDSEATGRRSIHHQIHIRLSPYLKRAQVGHAWYLAHHGLHLFGFLLQRLKVGTEELYRQFTFHAADSFFHIVGNRLREIPIHAGKLI